MPHSLKGFSIFGHASQFRFFSILPIPAQALPFVRIPLQDRCKLLPQLPFKKNVFIF